MIESPTHHLSDIQDLLKNSSSPSRSRTPSDEEIIAQKTTDLIHCSTTNSYFLRLSWTNKLHFLSELSERLQNVGSIALLLKTLHTASGKIRSYCKATTKKLIVYDRILYDHDRMLEDKIVKEVIFQDLAWFETLIDKDQVAILIGLLRIAGGAIIHILYRYLHDLYNRRLQEISLEKNKPDESEKEVVEDKPPPFNRRKSSIFHSELIHDLKDPNHQKCLQLNKKWNDMMTKYKHEVERASGNKSSNKKKKRKQKKKKKKKKKDDKSCVDWIQIMPIWIVKKIFSYLDKKTLMKAKKVNEYWKWVINDLKKEKKVKKLLNKTKNQIKKTIGNDFDISSIPNLAPEQKRISRREKRMEKLIDRGAILEKLRYITTGPLYEECLITKALEVAPYSVSYLENIAAFPRVKRSNSPMYKRPKYICKDYKIICKEGNIWTDSSCPRFVKESIYSTMSSEEIEF